MLLFRRNLASWLLASCCTIRGLARPIWERLMPKNIECWNSNRELIAILMQMKQLNLRSM